MKEGNTKDLMKIIYGYADSRKILISIGRILAAASAFVAMVPFYLLWRIIKIAIEGTDLAAIRPLAWEAVGLTVLSLLLYIAALMCTHIAAFRVQANMREQLLAKVITLPLGVFDEDGTGKIRRIIQDSTAATETFIAHNLPDKAVATATPIGIVVLLAVFDWRLGLACLIPAGIGFIFMMTMMGKKLQENMAKYQNALGIMSSEATEYVRGIPVVKTFGQTVFSFRRFKESIDNYSDWSISYTKLLRKPMTGFMTAINAIFAAIVIAAFLMTRNGVTPGIILNVMYYIIASPLLTVALTKIAYSGEQQMVVNDALRRVNSILEIDPLPESKSSQETEGNTIEFDHVSYRYRNADRDALHDISLTIGDGEHAALVGPSGGGKTTAAALIARFFDVTEGAVRIGGVNVKEMSSEELMKRVSFVFQDSRLLKTSILENVRMAKPEATTDEVLAALQTAQCGDIIEKLHDGIDTVIGAKGTYLSGGEQQRIAIARAVLKNAPILILDEATAYADPDNEIRVQAALKTLSKGKTVIMIAHRLSTVTDADRIFVLQEGNVVESGKHGELLEQNGLYRRMFEEYSRSASWKVGA